MASAAGADDERADALERGKPLVVVVVAGEDDVGTAAAERRPQRAEGGVRAVQAGAEARVVHVRDGAGGRIRSEVRGEPALLRRAALAAAGGAAVGVQDDDVPVAEVVGVVARAREAEVRDRSVRVAGAVLVIAECGARPAAEPAPRVAVAELLCGSALVHRVAEDSDGSGDPGDERGGPFVTRRAAGGDVAGGDQRGGCPGASSESAVATVARIKRRRAAARAGARRSGSRSAPRPCAGCRRR